jgi:hypothetical protein
MPEQCVHLFAGNGSANHGRSKNRFSCRVGFLQLLQTGEAQGQGALSPRATSRTEILSLPRISLDCRTSSTKKDERCAIGVSETARRN